MTKADLRKEFKDQGGIWREGTNAYVLFLEKKIIDGASYLRTKIGNKYAFNKVLVDESFDAGEYSLKLRSSIGEYMHRISKKTKGKFMQRKVNNRIIVTRIA